MVIYKSSVEQRAKDRDRQLWEHRSVWVGAVSVQSCQILTPPLRKKPKKKKKIHRQETEEKTMPGKTGHLPRSCRVPRVWINRTWTESLKRQSSKNWVFHTSRHTDYLPDLMNY